MSTGLRSPAARPAPIKFNRTGSSYDTGGDANATTSADDPRSPGVPRTPGGKESKTMANKTPSKGSSSARAIGQNQNEPESPLAAFITQTDASGTPTHHRAPSNVQTGQAEGFTAAQDGTSSSQEASASGVGLLCPCFKSKDNEGEGAQMTDTSMKVSGAPSPTSPTSRPQSNGRGGQQSPANGKKGPLLSSKKGAQFGSFQYEDPAHPSDQPILPPVAAEDAGKMCLVLDLDETLVHSSFRAVPNPDYIIPVQIEDVVHHVYVCKRPGVDEYLKRCGARYEVVIYTASLNKYADPLLDKLDIHGVIKHRLFRESCTQYQGNYVKNLSLLGRDLSTCVIVDNSPLSYLFHPENAVGCLSWIDQQDDDELRVIQDFCETVEQEDDVRHHMRHWRQGATYDPSVNR